jgi:hypothetical protein
MSLNNLIIQLIQNLKEFKVIRQLHINRQPAIRCNSVKEDD